MRLRPIKFDFNAQKKEAHQEVEHYITASLRNELVKVLQLKRPQEIAKAILTRIKK
jgi:hypothetical protein